jgi:hypothetical protein
MTRDYGATGRTNAPSTGPAEEDVFLPGPEDVKTFPDRWRKAPAYILLIIVLLT